MDAALRGKEIYDSGYCCSESVLMAVAEKHGIQSDLIPKIATGFCGGFSRTSGPCGAMTGGIMAISLFFGRAESDDSRDRNTEAVQEFIREFEKHNGATGCTEILGANLSIPEEQQRVKDEGLSKKCGDISAHAAGLADAIIEKYAAKVV